MRFSGPLQRHDLARLFVEYRICDRGACCREKPRSIAGGFDKKVADHSGGKNSICFPIPDVDLTEENAIFARKSGDFTHDKARF